MLKSRESVCWHVDTFSVQGRKSDCLVSFGNTSQRSMCASEYFSLIMRIFSEFTRSTLVSPGVALTYDQKLNSFTVCADESFILCQKGKKKKNHRVCKLSHTKLDDTLSLWGDSQRFLSAHRGPDASEGGNVGHTVSTLRPAAGRMLGLTGG